MDTWASLVLQTSVPGLASAPDMPLAVDEWTEHYDGTVIYSDDEGDILAYIHMLRFLLSKDRTETIRAMKNDGL